MTEGLAGPNSASIPAETTGTSCLPKQPRWLKDDDVRQSKLTKLIQLYPRLLSCGFKSAARLGLLMIVWAAPFHDDAKAAEEGTVKSQHGDWQVVCKDPPPGAKGEVCALVQSVTAEDRNNVGLTVYFQKFSNGSRVLRVFAPVGVLLPPGLGLKIDDKDVGHAPFLRCQNFACYAQVVVEDSLVEKLKNGKTAIFVIFQTEEAGIGIPISLAGFAQALAALN